MLYVLEPAATTAPHTGAVRLRFLLESLTALDGELRARGSSLHVARVADGADVAAEVAAAAARCGATTLVYEDDDSPAGRQRDAAVGAAAAAAGLAVVTRSGHTLYPPALLLDAAGGVAPRTMAAFTSLVDRVGPPRPPLPTVGDDLPPPPPPPPPLGDGEAVADGAVPSLGALGWDAAAAAGLRVRGGEAAALQRMEAFLGRRGGAVVRAFEKPKTSMVAWRTPDTTVLSPYLAAGVLSPRTFYARLREVEAAGNGRHTRPPVSLVGQLLWREHFHLLAGSVPHFGRMAGNPLCRQIPWDDPSTDAAAAARHAAWATARTGYPAVDACMAQLRKEGWVHHLGRHLLACFATRGDLWLSWEAGAATFEELLLDWDPALNAGNWMWLSASAFFNSYFRVYGPVTWMRKVDPEGKFIRHYLPALARLPTAYIYEPWKAPAGVQAAAGVRIGDGGDYPAPIVDHAVVSKVNIDRMAKAFRSGAAAEKGGNKAPAVKVGGVGGWGGGANAKPAAATGAPSRGGRSAKAKADAAPVKTEESGGAGGLRTRSGRVSKKR
ncbi:hypothetical protein BU14_0401s0002 [Porphyra umbilicalis]|uniref:Photolyase/cryptochrome alpha/beta domain-containing protein n=1 Tax=Porphyra umbilicalis TaxID=2786 RepID=A0A1X6NW38_PORUM|nr:hypothetical protein BU14_0401s0002 [Porphyra umbilicalis]|eukprot:OSX72831.1 hypothetical protein BU14_0401s0002 [Porphyra umbilicalis]